MSIAPQNIAVLGFDPGLDGGMAAISLDGSFVEVFAMPSLGSVAEGGRTLDLASIVSKLEAWNRNFSRLVGAWVEKVHSMPKQGVASTFKFGRVFGNLEGILAGLHIPCTLVRPQTWKKLILAGTDKTKDAAVRYILQRWGKGRHDLLRASSKSRTEHDGMAEALCIAEFGRLQVVSSDQTLCTSTDASGAYGCLPIKNSLS